MGPRVCAAAASREAAGREVDEKLDQQRRVQEAHDRIANSPNGGEPGGSAAPGGDAMPDGGTAPGDNGKAGDAGKQGKDDKKDKGGEKGKADKKALPQTSDPVSPAALEALAMSGLAAFGVGLFRRRH